LKASALGLWLVDGEWAIHVANVREWPIDETFEIWGDSILYYQYEELSGDGQEFEWLKSSPIVRRQETVSRISRRIAADVHVGKTKVGAYYRCLVVVLISNASDDSGNGDGYGNSNLSAEYDEEQCEQFALRLPFAPTQDTETCTLTERDSLDSKRGEEEEGEEEKEEEEEEEKNNGGSRSRRSSNYDELLIEKQFRALQRKLQYFPC
jgi:hypothetical protein